LRQISTLTLAFEHIRWLPRFGWLAINILIPVVAPLVLLWLAGIPPATAPLAVNNVRKSIGKGELLWAVMGMAAATCYELASLQELKTDASWTNTIWTTFGFHIFLIVVAVVLVGLSSLDLPAGFAYDAPHIPSMPIFLISLVSLVIVSVTYSASHATLTEQERQNEKIKTEAGRKFIADKQTIIDRIELCVANAQDSVKHCIRGTR